jgi:hypothetical protein
MPETIQWDWKSEPLPAFRRYYMRETIQADDPAADRWARDGHRQDHTQALAPIEPDAIWLPRDDEHVGLFWFDALTEEMTTAPPGGA